ncbi:hypothetical protein [uncultured Brachyspira sp.]|uniref:hypothetical protein n=1 Tax=uncultured Brachyspira sp. TaxID=221953 RepID=UPI00261CA07A|nr:hypothetical protein [uncultured Brachyspira sp.]
MFKLFKAMTAAFLLIFICGSVSYAEIGGFELLINVPIGAGITVVEKNVPVAGNPKGGGNFQIGLEANVGYMFQIRDDMGVSLLGSLGYDFTGFNYSKNNKSEIYKASINDIYLGFYPKFNIKGFSIGINVGAKFTLPSRLNYESSSYSKSITYMSEPRTYIRGVFNYSIFFKDNMAVNVGLYIGYDWGFSWSDNLTRINVIKDESYGNVDIGVQIGYRLGPKF